MTVEQHARRARRSGAIAALVVLSALTAGCTGAGNQVPNAKVPVASGHAADVSNCATASRSAIQQLDGQIHNGERPQAADVVKQGNAWYVAASATGTEAVDHGHVGIGLWQATSDPKADPFSGKLIPLNSWAVRAEQQPSASASATASASASASAAGSLSPTSSAAKHATSCMITDSRTSN